MIGCISVGDSCENGRMYGGRERCSPDEDGRAFHKFLPQILPELFGTFLLAVNGLHEEGCVVYPRISVYIMSALQY